MNLRSGLERLVEQYGEYGQEVQQWRVQPRTPAAAPIPVVIERYGGTALAGSIRDLSRGGVGFTVPAALTVGEHFDLRAVLRGRAVRITGRVANCRRDPSGAFCVGAELIQAERGNPAAPPRPPASTPPGAASRPAAPPRHQPPPTFAPMPMRPPPPVLDDGERLLHSVAALLDRA